MEINNIILREYLESLTEKDELNRIFAILLEALNFNILTKPSENIGIKEYGKDIVAVGVDEDGVKKKFYFELKGGKDRNITERNFNGKDGIAESLNEATYVQFISAFPKFDKLPTKIVIVHNGVVNGNVKTVFESLLKTLTDNNKNTEYDRWGIDRLSKLFSHNLFSKYLLTDANTTKLFNRVLINLNSSEKVTTEFSQLIENLLESTSAKGFKRQLSRFQKMKLQSVRLIAFIVYNESKNEYDNLEIAKKYLSSLIIQYWGWVLNNKLESFKPVVDAFKKCLDIYYNVLNEYYVKTMPFVTSGVDGLASMNAGRYEQVGYTIRTFEYVQYLHVTMKLNIYYEKENTNETFREMFIKILMNNRVASRPLIDIHSIPVALNLLFLIEASDLDSAKNYLKSVCYSLYDIWKYHGRIPDANNNLDNVIKFVVERNKPYFYSDSTSLLINMIMEFIYILDMEDLFDLMKKLVLESEIKLGLFIPHQGLNSVSLHLSENPELDIEGKLFTGLMTDGFQDELLLDKSPLKGEDANLSYSEFRDKIKVRKNDFNYDYRTEKAGFGFLLDLAHIGSQTSYFPDKWRFLL